MSSGIPLIPDILLKRIENWADKRQILNQHSAVIDQRHLYILPTKSGLFFLFTLLVIFIGAINYENNMAFLLCFLLASISILSMIYTHLNIKNIQVEITAAKNVFVGQMALFPITLSHRNTNNSICIQIEADHSTINIASLPPNKNHTVQLPIKAQQRGRLILPRVKVYSLYPLGLFYAWSWINIKAHCLAYPKPARKNFLDNNTSNNSSTNTSTKINGYDDFQHLRDYQHGDTPAHIAWKSYARSGELFTKTFQSQTSEDIYLDWFTLDDNLSHEEKLSILCRGIIEADQAGLRYGIKLPNNTINCDSSHQHKHHCLTTLALFSQ